MPTDKIKPHAFITDIEGGHAGTKPMGYPPVCIECGGSEHDYQHSDQAIDAMIRAGQAEVKS